MAEENSEKKWRKEDWMKKDKSSGTNGGSGIYDSLKKLSAILLILLVIAYFVRNTFFVYIDIALIVLLLLNFLSNFPVIKPIIGVLKVIFTLVIIVSVGYVVYQIIVGGYETGLLGVVSAKTQDFGIAKAFKAWTKEIGFFAANPEQVLSSGDPFAAPPKSAETNPTKGIIFGSPSSRKTQYLEGEQITVEGEVDVIALQEKDTSVSFSCNINIGGINKTGDLTLLGILGNEVTINQGQDETLHYLCRFDGIKLNLTKEERNNTKKEIRFFTANVLGEYQDFTTTSILSVYTLQDDLLTQMKAQGNLDKDKLVTPARCVLGCGLTRLSLSSPEQPQTEVTPYGLWVALRKDRDYYGDITKIEKIEVILPPENFELVACENFGGDNVLDSSDSYWAHYNKEIVEESFGQATEFDFYCDYKVTRPAVKLVTSDIRADATYDYRVATAKMIEVKEGEFFTGPNIESNNNPSTTTDDGEYGEATYYNVG